MAILTLDNYPYKSKLFSGTPTTKRELIHSIGVNTLNEDGSEREPQDVLDEIAEVQKSWSKEEAKSWENLLYMI